MAHQRSKAAVALYFLPFGSSEYNDIIQKGGCRPYLSVEDLNDDVTDNMGGILKSEEKGNVLHRQEWRDVQFPVTIFKNN